jgi:hypothetical protein
MLRQAAADGDSWAAREYQLMLRRQERTKEAYKASFKDQEVESLASKWHGCRRPAPAAPEVRLLPSLAAPCCWPLRRCGPMRAAALQGSAAPGPPAPLASPCWWWWFAPGLLHAAAG